MLLHPNKTNFSHLDTESQEIMRQTIFLYWIGNVIHADFLEFVKENKIFAKLMTPAGYGSENARWDTSRIAAFTEICGFYGLCYWYTYQVSSLGLGPIWMSANEEIKQKAAALLEEGNIFAFGLSEKEHGADIYSSGMFVTSKPDGTYSASGSKYYRHR